MKRIGLLGGMSRESNGQYYRYINEEVRRRLGGRKLGRLPAPLDRLRRDRAAAAQRQLAAGRRPAGRGVTCARGGGS